MSTQASRILNTKTAIPDGALMIPAASIRLLSHSAHSPYKVMKGHTAVVESGSASKGSSFRYQSTPCENLPEAPCFEFVSSFWEDKKPVHQLLEHAYRQNRMSTASALRHLHSLHISAPVFGLVWASGTVRAHVDWWKVDGDKPPVSRRYMAMIMLFLTGSNIYRSFYPHRTQVHLDRGRTFSTSGNWRSQVISLPCTS